MKKRVIVSERGTVTIPTDIRKMARINPGDILEFETRKDGILMRQLILRYPDKENFMNDNEWEEFDKMVKSQLKRGEYTSYSDLEKAKEYSRKLRE